MWSKQGERIVSLNDSQYNTLCKVLETDFIFDNKEMNMNGVVYTLTGSTNGLKVLDNGWIIIFRNGDEVKISYGISMRTTFILSMALGIGLSMILLFSVFIVLLTLLPLFFIMLYLILVSFINAAVFKSKIEKCLEKI